MNSGFTFSDESGSVTYKDGKYEEVEKKKTKTRNRSSAKDEDNVVNPIFRAMKAYTDDEYWINKLTKWSHNKTCNKFKYKNNSIIYNRIATKQKIFSITLDDDKIYDSFIKFKRFMEEHSRDISDADRKKNLLQEIDTHQRIENSQKNNLKLKGALNKADVAVEIIDDFISKHIEEDDPTGLVTISLLDAIKLIILTKNHRYINFDESTRQITSIDGLTKNKYGFYECTIDLIKSSKNSRRNMDITDYDSDTDTICTSSGPSKTSGVVAFEKHLERVAKIVKR